MKHLVIGDKITNIPVIQGGMGVGVSFSGLASAVANAGGIGTISAVIPGFRNPDLYKNYREANINALRNEIQIAKSKTSGLLAVNIMVALTNYQDMVETAIEENVDFIISGAGLPLSLPQYRKADSNTKLIPIISTSRAADILIKKWLKNYDYLPDALVLESPFSGGHQGVKYNDINKDEFSLETQLLKVLDVVTEFENSYGKRIPVVVAGGVYTGADIKYYMDKGASGAQLGTRFITTHECDADIKFKNEYLKCQSKDDIIVIESPVGLPLRVIKNQFIESVKNGEKKPVSCPYKCLHNCNWKSVSFCIAKALMNAHHGNLEEGILCSSINGNKNNEIISVAQLFENIKEEYRNAP